MPNMTAPTLLALGYALGPNGTAEALEIDGLLGGSAITGDIAVVADVATIQTTRIQTATLAAIKTDVGTTVLMTAAAVDRQVQVAVRVTTTFADGDGAQPTLQIGQTGTVNKFADTGDFTGKAAAAANLMFAGTLSAGQQLLATQVAGTGTTETGAYTITVQALS